MSERGNQPARHLGSQVDSTDAWMGIGYIYIYIYTPIYLSIYLSVCLSIYLFLSLSIYISICISFSLSLYVYIYIYLWIQRMCGWRREEHRCSGTETPLQGQTYHTIPFYERNSCNISTISLYDSVRETQSVIIIIIS